MKRFFKFTVALCAAPLLFATLTEDQRVQDFQTLSSIYAKSYGPANWKFTSLGVNIFDIGPWLVRVRAAKSDLDYVQVAMEYVASFQDAHDAVSLTTNFFADLGLYCDLYDGKVVIDLIDRDALPKRSYPFVEGDELVSLDGRPAIDIGRELAKLEGWGNPRAQLRWAIDKITYRSQSNEPHAVDLPDISTVVIRRQSGAVETYKLTWTKTGLAIRNLGSAPTPGALSKGLVAGHQRPSRELEPPMSEQDLPLWQSRYYDAIAMKVTAVKMRGRGRVGEAEDGSPLEPSTLINFGGRNPIFDPPAGFVLRQGRNFTDRFYSGTYVSEGQRVGFIRIKNFTTLTNAQLNQFATEINYFNANTDGLVVDIMSNPGGNACTPNDFGKYLIPKGFNQIGLAFRPSLSLIAEYDALASDLESLGAPSYYATNYRFLRDQLFDAFNNGRGMTGPIPICGSNLANFPDFPVTSSANAYQKPMILLTDDFTTSAGDLFAALIQDNKRAKLVGNRTAGAGGNVVDVSAGWWSETNATLTQSLMVRNESRAYPGIPASPFIENVGVRPDIELDYMTVANVVDRGKSFVDAFSKIIVAEIKASQP